MSSRAFGDLWSLLDIHDEGQVHQMETVLRKLGCYNQDDLAFLPHRKVEWPKSVKPVIARKFKIIWKYYQMGHSLTPSTTMSEIMMIVNPPAGSSRQPDPVVVQRQPPPRAVQPSTMLHNHRSIPVQRPPPQPVYTPQPPPEPVYVPQQPPPPPVQPVVPPPQPRPQVRQPARPKKLLHVVIVGDAEPGTAGWLHLNQFRDDNMRGVVVHSVVQSRPSYDDDFVLFCRENHIQLTTKLAPLRVPSPSLVVITAPRLHEMFKLLDVLHPEAILLDLPGTMMSKGLQTLENIVTAKNIPCYLNLGRTLAPYVQGTLEVATTSGIDPVVTWHCEEHHTPAELDSMFSKGSILKTLCLEELVIAVMYFGVKVKALNRFRVNPALTQRRTLGSTADYVKVAFQMITASRIQMFVIGSRIEKVDCHMGIVTDHEGRTIRQFDHLHAHCDKMLKRRIVRSILEENDKAPEVLPTIRIGVEALKLAEEAMKHLDSAMDAYEKKKPSPKKQQSSSSFMRWMSS